MQVLAVRVWDKRKSHRKVNRDLTRFNVDGSWVYILGISDCLEYTLLKNEGLQSLSVSMFSLLRLQRNWACGEDVEEGNLIPLLLKEWCIYS